MLTPSSFVFVLNVRPAPFNAAANFDKFMIIALPVLAVANRTLVIHKRFEAATRCDQVQLHVRSAFSFLIAAIFAWYFNIDKPDDRSFNNEHLSDNTSQVVVLLLLIFQVVILTTIRLRSITVLSTQASDRETVSLNELRIFLVRTTIRNAVTSCAKISSAFLLVKCKELLQILMICIGLAFSAKVFYSRLKAAAITIGAIPLAISAVLLLDLVLRTIRWGRQTLRRRRQLAILATHRQQLNLQGQNRELLCNPE